MQRKRVLVGTVDLIQGDEPGRPNNVHTYISSHSCNFQILVVMIYDDYKICMLFSIIRCNEVIVIVFALHVFFKPRIWPIATTLYSNLLYLIKGSPVYTYLFAEIFKKLLRWICTLACQFC